MPDNTQIHQTTNSAGHHSCGTQFARHSEAKPRVLGSKYKCVFLGGKVLSTDGECGCQFHQTHTHCYGWDRSVRPS